MITFPSHKLAVNRLVALITNEVVEGLNNRAEVEAFRNGINAILALRRAVVVIRAFEDEAEAFGNKSDLRCRGGKGLFDACGIARKGQP